MTDRPEDDGVSDYELHRLYENVTEQDADVVLRLETRIATLTTERDRLTEYAHEATMRNQRLVDERSAAWAERDEAVALVDSRPVPVLVGDEAVNAYARQLETEVGRLREALEAANEALIALALSASPPEQPGQVPDAAGQTYYDEATVPTASPPEQPKARPALFPEDRAMLKKLQAASPPEQETE